jgi:Kef-type K+ transport system membrane component KefB
VGCCAAGWLARLVGLPAFLGHLSAGMALGPVGLDRVRHMAQLDSLGQLGVEVFLFLLGLELDLGLFAGGATARLAIRIACALTVAAVSAGWLVAWSTGLALSDALVVGGCVALSSTPVAVGALQKDEFAQPHGELLLAVLIVQDGIFGLFLALLSSYGGGAQHAEQPISAGGALMILLGCGASVWALAQIERRLANSCQASGRLHWMLGYGRRAGCWASEQIVGSDEGVLLGSLSMLAVGRQLTEAMGLSGELGCLAAGLLVGHPPKVLLPAAPGAPAEEVTEIGGAPLAAGATAGHGHGHGRAMRVVMPVRDLLISLFFASCGQHLSPGFIRDLLWSLVSLATFAMLFKAAVVVLSLRCLLPRGVTSPSNRAVGLVAAGLAQISEVSFFIGSRAKMQGLIGRETHFVLLAVTSISLALAPLLWMLARQLFGHHNRSSSRNDIRMQSMTMA